MNTLGGYMVSLQLTAEASDAEHVWFSEPEVKLADALRQRGFKFEQQKRVKRGKTSGVLDFWVEDILAVEVDGKKFHNASGDSARDSELRFEHGFHTLRLPAWRVVYRCEECVCRIALRLAQLGARPAGRSPERDADAELLAMRWAIGGGTVVPFQQEEVA